VYITTSRQTAKGKRWNNDSYQVSKRGLKSVRRFKCCNQECHLFRNCPYFFKELAEMEEVEKGKNTINTQEHLNLN